MDTKTETLELVEVAITAVKAVRDHYEGIHQDYRYPETPGPSPLDIVSSSNQYLNPLLRAQKTLIRDAEFDEEVEKGG